MSHQIPSDLIDDERVVEHRTMIELEKVLDVNCPDDESPAQILDHLYLGDGGEARNIGLLQKSGITHILNCASEDCPTNATFYGDSFHYLGIPADDSCYYDMTQHFDEAFRFISDAKAANGKVFVHCVMGINRSGAITVAYAMRHEGMKLMDAARHVKQRRFLLLTNHSFRKQLITYARENNYL